MSSFWAMTVANIKMTVRNRTALFWLAAFPLLFIVLFGYLFSEGGFNIDVGVAGSETSTVTGIIVQQMEEAEGFTIHRGEADAELAALEDGDRTLVVLFSEGSGASQVSAEIVFDQSNPTVSQVGVSAVQQFLLEAEVLATGQPQLIETTTRGVDAEEVRYIDFLVPGILAMALLTNGIFALSSTFVSYRERGVLRRIKATPFPLWAFIISRISVQVVVAMAQAVILLSAGVILFDVHVSSSYLSLAVMVALGALAFLSIGFAISAFASNSEVADSASNAIAFPMMFLGGIFFPVDEAPAWLKPITEIIPVTYLANGLREIILHGATLMDVWPSVLVMLATASVGLVIAVRFFRWEARSV